MARGYLGRRAGRKFGGYLGSSARATGGFLGPVSGLLGSEPLYTPYSGGQGPTAPPPRIIVGPTGGEECLNPCISTSGSRTSPTTEIVCPNGDSISCYTVTDFIKTVSAPGCDCSNAGSKDLSSKRFCDGECSSNPYPELREFLGGMGG